MAARTRTGPGVGRDSPLRLVRLDATMAGLRPRELDRSARRDLASVLRRLSLGFGGLDVFVPPAHFGDPSRGDRAAEAVLAAIDLAADLAGLSQGSVGATSVSDPARVVSVELPGSISAAMIAEFDRHAQSRGVRLADHAIALNPGKADGANASVGTGRPASFGLGIDPAALFAAGQDPVRAVLGAGAFGGVVSARLSDLSSRGRVLAGSVKQGGRLDVLAYLATLSAVGYRDPLVIDLRGLPGQDDAARAVVESMHEWAIQNPGMMLPAERRP